MTAGKLPREFRFRPRGIERGLSESFAGPRCGVDSFVSELASWWGRFYGLTATLRYRAARDPVSRRNALPRLDGGGRCGIGESPRHFGEGYGLAVRLNGRVLPAPCSRVVSCSGMSDAGRVVSLPASVDSVSAWAASKGVRCRL